MKLSHLQTGLVEPGKLYKVPDAPDNVMLDLTWRCNLRCSFCYNEDVSLGRAGPGRETTAKLLQTLSDWGVREVLYLGGEPTLLPHFDDVVRLGASLGLVQRVVTNGLLMAPPRAQLLARHDVEVGVSLQGTTASEHDRIVGRPGAFEASWRAIGHLVEAGCPVWVQYTPTSAEPRGLTMLDVRLRKDFGEGISFLDVNRLLPYGKGAEPPQNLVPTEEQWWEAMKDIGRLRLDGRAVRVESVPHCWVLERARGEGLSEQLVEAILGSIRPCWMGIGQIALDPEGRLKLCPGGPPLGPSILDNNPRTLWQEHTLLTSRREFRFLPSQCVDFEQGTTCGRFYACGGGCRGAAGVPTGAPDALMTMNDNDKGQR